MPPRFPSLMLTYLLTLAAPAGAQPVAQERDSASAWVRPLNLSLPREAIGTSSLGAAPISATGSGGAGSNLPDLGTGSGGSRLGQAGRLPYGSGYEARQRQGLAGAGGSPDSGPRSGNGYFGGLGGGGRGQGGRR